MESVFETETLETETLETETPETVQTETLVLDVSADETVNNQLADISLQLTVIICLIGIACGIALGSILWGRIKK